MPKAIVKAMVTRCQEGNLPLWAKRLKARKNLTCEQLGEAIASMVGNARKNAEEPEGGFTVETLTTYVEEKGLAPEDRKVVTWRQLLAEDLDPHTLAETFVLEDVEILKPGTWNGDEYSLSDLKDMVAAFDRVGFRPPVKLGHAEDQKILQADGLPAAGWVEKLKLVGETLVATLKDVPKKVAELIRLGAYRERSAEVYWNFRGAGDGKTYPRVLRALSLLGADVPAVKGMSPLDAIRALYLSDVGEDEDVHIAGVELHLNTDNGGTNPMPDSDKGTAPAVTAEDLKKLTDQIAELKVSIDKKDEKIEKLESQITVERTSRLSEEVANFIDRAKSAGKLAPAEEGLAKIALETANRTETRKYADGDDEVELSGYAALKKLIMGRPEAFKVSSSDRKGDKSKEKHDESRVTKYDDGAGGAIEFDESAAEKAQDEAKAAGKTDAEAYKAYREAGLAKALGGDR